MPSPTGTPLLQTYLLFASVAAAAWTASACRTPASGGRADSHALDVVGSPPLPTPVPPFTVKPASQLPIVATINSVSGDWMCVGFDSLWVPSGSQLYRIDPVQHTVVATIAAAGNFCQASPTGNQLWLSSVFDGKLTRIDPTTNTVTGTFTVPPTASSEGSFAVSDTGVWLVTSDHGTNSGTLTRVDPTSGQIVATIKIADDSHGVAVQGNYVWVTSAESNLVTQVDPATNSVVKTIAVAARPRFIAGGESGVWVLNQGTGTVTHIDPVTGTVLAEINTYTPGGGGDIAAGEGGVWVAVFGKPITRIDPNTNKVVAQFIGGSFGDAVRAGAGFVWVSGGTISQFKFAPLTP